MELSGRPYATELPQLQKQGPNGKSAAGVAMSVFTYGQGVVGNSAYQTAYDAAVKVHWLHQNDRDIIPRFGFLTPLPGLAFDYAHVGTRVFLDEDSCIIGATDKGMKSEESDGEGSTMVRRCKLTLA